MMPTMNQLRRQKVGTMHRIQLSEEVVKLREEIQELKRETKSNPTRKTESFFRVIP